MQVHHFSCGCKQGVRLLLQLRQLARFTPQFESGELLLQGVELRLTADKGLPGGGKRLIIMATGMLPDAAVGFLKCVLQG